MKTQSAEPRDRRWNSDREVNEELSAFRAPFAPTLALVVVLAVGAFFLIAPVLHSVLPFTDLPEPFPDHHQNAESLLFVFAFAVLLPLSTLFVPRVCDRIAARQGGGALSALVALVALGLVVAALVVRAAAGLWVLGGAMALWALAAAALLVAAATGRIEVPSGLGERRAMIWAGVGVGALGLAFSFADVSSISPVVLVVGAAAVAAILLIGRRAALPRLDRPWGLFVDAALILLLLLAVPNLVVFTPESSANLVETQVIHFHQNFFLGPANQVLGGGAMLVDTLSQYGVASIYLLVGAFQLIPAGNGTLGLVEGGLSALMFAGGYLVLRSAGVSRLLSSVALAVAVVVLVFGLVFPLGALLQHGAIRFGLPMAVIVGAVVESRWPRWGAPAVGVQMAAVGLSSIWALEGFAYTLLTIFTVIGVGAWLRPRGERRSLALRRLAGVAVACLITHLAFAAITLIATGELPDWGWYLATLREFLAGPVGDLTYDFSPWSPGLATGILYFASAAGVVLLFRRRRDVVERESTMIIAIAGTTAMGIALFSYLVNRSADHIVAYVSLPAIMLGALWIWLALRPWLGIDLSLRRTAVAAGMLVSVVLIATAASSVPTRFSQSALAHFAPGGKPLRGALQRLNNPPPLNPAAPEGVRLLEEQMPGEDRSLVITDADLGVEILVSSERSSVLPLGDPWEDSLVPEGHLEALGAAVDELEPGTRMLVDAGALDTLRTLRDDPGRDPIDDPVESTSLVLNGLANVQQWALKRIGERYRLRTVAAGNGGLEVVELVPRQTV